MKAVGSRLNVLFHSTNSRTNKANICAMSRRILCKYLRCYITQKFFVTSAIGRNLYAFMFLHENRGSFTTIIQNSKVHILCALNCTTETGDIIFHLFNTLLTIHKSSALYGEYFKFCWQTQSTCYNCPSLFSLSGHVLGLQIGLLVC